MPATSISTQVPKGPFGTISAGQLAVTETAADVADGNSFTFTGAEILIAHNTDTGSHNITLTSVADNFGRTGDVTTYAIAAGVIAAFSFRGGAAGWKQSNGTVLFSADNATVKFAILAPL